MSAHMSARTAQRCTMGIRLFVGMLVPWALALPFIMTAPAVAGDREACSTLSFAPLDFNVPACNRIINSGKLLDDAMFKALMARARAHGWAMTYNFGHKVDPEALLKFQLADLNRAVAIARHLHNKMNFRMQFHKALSERASVQAQLGHGAQAVADYSKAIGLGKPPYFLDLFGRSVAYEQLGRLDLAIKDMSAVVAMTNGKSNHANWLVRGAELYEKSGDATTAIMDYRQAVQLMPDHTIATKALRRLDAGP